MFKDAAVNVLERNKNKGRNITEYALVMETLSKITDQELQYDLLSNLEDGYAEPEDLDTVEPRAGEIEDMDDPEDEDNRRRLGVPTTRHRWANGIVRYKVVYENNFSGYWMFVRRALPAMVELESIAAKYLGKICVITELPPELPAIVVTTILFTCFGNTFVFVKPSSLSAIVAAVIQYSIQSILCICTVVITVSDCSVRDRILHSVILLYS